LKQTENICRGHNIMFKLVKHSFHDSMTKYPSLSILTSHLDLDLQRFHMKKPANRWSGEYTVNHL